MANSPLSDISNRPTADTPCLSPGKNKPESRHKVRRCIFPEAAGNGRVRVVCRVRPAKVSESGARPACCVVPTGNRKSITIQRDQGPGVRFDAEPVQKCYTFDRVFPETSTQEEVYAEAANEAVEGVLKGYNGAIIAYGQTSSGKTHTMDGSFDQSDVTDRSCQGVIPRVFEKIFGLIGQDNEWDVFVSSMEVYCDQLRDLLTDDNRSLALEEDGAGNINIRGISSVAVTHIEEAWRVLCEARARRSTGSTRMNQRSSRSHALVRIRVCSRGSKTVTGGHLWLVDLAGSERVKKTGATGTTFTESTQINKDLSVLGRVVSAITAEGHNHVPYRESKLTRVLRDAFGGSCKTTLIITIAPESYHTEETLSSLEFGCCARHVRNEIVQNRKKPNTDEVRHQLAEYEEELTQLRLVVRHLQSRIAKSPRTNVSVTGCSPLASPARFKLSAQTQTSPSEYILSPASQCSLGGEVFQTPEGTPAHERRTPAFEPPLSTMGVSDSTTEHEAAISVAVGGNSPLDVWRPLDTKDASMMTTPPAANSAPIDVLDASKGEMECTLNEHSAMHVPPGTDLEAKMEEQIELNARLAKVTQNLRDLLYDFNCIVEGPQDGGHLNLQEQMNLASVQARLSTLSADSLALVSEASLQESRQLLAEAPLMQHGSLTRKCTPTENDENGISLLLDSRRDVDEGDGGGLWFNGHFAEDDVLVVKGDWRPLGFSGFLKSFEWYRVDEHGNRRRLTDHDRLFYRATKDDVGHYIACECSCSIRGMRSTRGAITDRPIAPVPPRVLSLTIEGDFKVGCRLTARGTYCGGKEGKSRIQWYRLGEDKLSPNDEKFNEKLIAIPGARHMVYVPTADDIRKLLFVRYTPVRADGVVGDPVLEGNKRVLISDAMRDEAKEILQTIQDDGEFRFDVCITAGLKENDCYLGLTATSFRIHYKNQTFRDIVRKFDCFRELMLGEADSSFKIVLENNKQVILLTCAPPTNRDVVAMVFRSLVSNFKAVAEKESRVLRRSRSVPDRAMQGYTTPESLHSFSMASDSTGYSYASPHRAPGRFDVRSLRVTSSPLSAQSATPGTPTARTQTDSERRFLASPVDTHKRSFRKRMEDLDSPPMSKHRRQVDRQYSPLRFLNEENTHKPSRFPDFFHHRSDVPTFPCGMPMAAPMPSMHHTVQATSSYQYYHPRRTLDESLSASESSQRFRWSASEPLFIEPDSEVKVNTTAPVHRLGIFQQIRKLRKRYKRNRHLSRLAKKSGQRVTPRPETRTETSEQARSSPGNVVSIDLPFPNAPQENLTPEYTGCVLSRMPSNP